MHYEKTNQNDQLYNLINRNEKVLYWCISNIFMVQLCGELL